MALALEHPERFAGLVQITPAYAVHRTDAAELEAWDRLAHALEHGGIDAFIEASGMDLPEAWRKQAELATRQRLERHRDLGAVADALRVVPRSEAFEGLEELDQVELPVLVVGSRDEADPLHPLELARAYAERLSRAELAVEDEGASPLAWQGARLSRAIGDWVERTLPDYS
jgi:pimeloyl-ACP methyl ester carboxylesterase